jgi:hypothetical protein
MDWKGTLTFRMDGDRPMDLGHATFRRRRAS